MVVGYLFLGSFLGLIAAVLTLLVGSPLSTAFYIYVLTGAVGTLSIALLPLVLKHFAVGIEGRRRSPASDEHPLVNGDG